MTIPQSRPDIREKDFDFIGQILSSNYVAGGAIVETLEKTFCTVVGTMEAIAVTSGTSALHLALLALEIGHGDEVVIPSYACAALLHAVHYTGASAVLCDVDLATLNPTCREIEPLLTPKTRAIVITHTFGFPADLEEVKRYGTNH